MNGEGLTSPGGGRNRLHRHNDRVPRVSKPKDAAPVSVLLAVQVFGTELRVALIRHFRRQPGLQKDAVEALGIPQGVVSRNIEMLVEAGVLIEAPYKPGVRRRGYSVDQQRVEELAQALLEHTLRR